jgi:hypothetical protein
VTPYPASTASRAFVRCSKSPSGASGCALSMCANAHPHTQTTNARERNQGTIKMLHSINGYDRDDTECWSPKLCCSVRSITYDFQTRTGRLDMPPITCCDMTGCINFFRAINPQVRRIETYAGGRRDTFYQRNEQNQWCAIDHHGRRFEWSFIAEPWR